MKTTKTLLYIAICLMLGIQAEAANLPNNVVLLGDSNLQIGGDDCTGESSWSKW